MSHIYDALPSRYDPRDYLLRVDVAPNLPDHAALPNVPVLDQGQEGACVGHGCAGARETLEVIATGAAPMVPLSRAFIYYEARKLEGATRQDAGAEVRDGAKVMQQLGVCTEQQFPYKVGAFAKAPPKVDVTAAAAYKIATYTRLTSPLAVRAALASNLPVVMGFLVYASFERIGADGNVPLPAPHEQLMGGHCVYCRGYAPDPKNPGKFIFTVVNSWGVGWADHGVCYMPEDYLGNPQLVSDLWSISL